MVFNTGFLFTGSSINPQTIFHNAASNIIYLVLFGIRYDYGSETLEQYVYLFKDSTKIANGPWGLVRCYIITSNKVYYQMYVDTLPSHPYEGLPPNCCHESERTEFLRMSLYDKLEL